jgi:DNA repair protein RadA/Sms
MAKPTTRYVCQQCGSTQSKWMGRCPDCDEWNTLAETTVTRSPRASRSTAAPSTMPQPLAAISSDDFQRIPVAIGELSRVLGGGIVPGSGVLIGGDPGIGKSTLLLQLAALLSSPEHKVLYVSGEESPQQIKMRAQRLGINADNLFVLGENHLESIAAHIEQMQPRLAIIDSVQSIASDALSSSAGTVSQVRDCASYLLRLAKSSSIPIFLVGHVTKEGAIAGPKVLEHMVDTVLYLEGERFHSYRLLRSAKNRFGSTDEVGIFEMTEAGLEEVSNPSEAFLAERLPNSAGSAIAVTMEGTRPLLVEIQALAAATAFNIPRRTANGVDFNRLLLLAAVLSRRVGMRLADQDIFINVVGGMRVNEPAADLAIAVAIGSSFRNLPVAADLAIVGEVGLSGELRSVSHLSQRLNEAARLGFKRCLTPRRRSRDNKAVPSGMEIISARTLQEALQTALV